MDGYNRVQIPVGSGESTDSTLQIEMSKLVQNKETVTVQANAESPIATSESSESKLPVAEATASPLRPATLIDALPLVPGVIRTPDGRVKIAGLDEQHSALIINSVDVTDPATGDFGLRSMRGCDGRRKASLPRRVSRQERALSGRQLKMDRPPWFVAEWACSTIRCRSILTPFATFRNRR
jgi:hypothetical protein